MVSNATCEQCPNCTLSKCKSGYYGNTCNVTCSPNCRAVPCNDCACEICDPTSGICTNGCDTGWYGDFCEIVCPENCARKFRLQDVCDRRNGACIDGCKQGFYGDVCNSTCSNGCFDRKCRQESGACAEGCIQGRVGVECTDREAGLGRDEIAGAAGGAFVIIVWAAVVIVLVFFVYRRRLKNYDVFNRNTPFSARRKRGSSRRHLRRRSSNSTAGNDVPEIDMEDDVFDNDEGFRHRPCCLHVGRVVSFEEDAPMRCTCKHRASRDFFVCRGYDIHENGQFQHILKESILHEEPINLDMDQIADSIEIKTLSAIRDPEPNVGDNYGDSSEVLGSRSGSDNPDAINRNCTFVNRLRGIPEFVKEEKEIETVNGACVYQHPERGTGDTSRGTSCEFCLSGFDMNNGTTLNSVETSHLEIQNEAQNSSLVNPGNINRGNNENEADQVIRFNSVQKQIVLNERKKGIRSHVHFPDEEDSKCNLLRPKSDYIQ